MSKKISFHISNARNNEPTAQVRIDNKPPVYLHSVIDPSYEARQWLKRVELLPSTLYLVLGAGLGYHVKALLASLPQDAFIMVLYREEEIKLLQFISERADGKWLFDKRIHCLPLMNLFDMSIIIGDAMINKVLKRIHICRHFPTMALADEEYERMEKELVPEIEKSMATNFNIRFNTNYRFFENYWKNFTKITLNPGARTFRNAFANTPVIVVGGGPSLNKNIQELKECVDKVVIIAAGTTLGALYKHGIKPHCLVVTDASDLMYESIKKYFSPETLLVASTNVQHQIVENYPGPICFMNTSIDLAGEMGKYLPENMHIRQTISVTTAAVDFANACGARRIILVGQDLSFADRNLEHADGIAGGTYKHWDTVKVPAYFGGEVDSIAQFAAIISYYNQYVLENPHIQFINATEGGAMIGNMRNLSLRTVHQELLVDKVDSQQIIKSHLEENKAETDYKRIIKLLYAMRNQCEKLVSAINKFCKNNNIVLNSTEDNVVHDPFRIDFFEKLYSIIVKHDAYQYIQSVIELRISLLKFQIQDNMPVEQQCQYYVNMTLGLLEVIDNFISWTDKNINELKKMRVEVDNEKSM